MAVALTVAINCHHKPSMRMRGGVAVAGVFDQYSPHRAAPLMTHLSKYYTSQIRDLQTYIYLQDIYKDVEKQN